MYNKSWDILVLNVYAFILSPRDVIFLYTSFRMPLRGAGEMHFSIVMLVVFHMIVCATGTYWDSQSFPMAPGWREIEGCRCQSTSIQLIFFCNYYQYSRSTQHSQRRDCCLRSRRLFWAGGGFRWKYCATRQYYAKRKYPPKVWELESSGGSNRVQHCSF